MNWLFLNRIIKQHVKVKYASNFYFLEKPIVYFGRRNFAFLSIHFGTRRTFQNCTICNAPRLKAFLYTSSVKWKMRKSKEEKKTVHVNAKALKIKSDNIISIWKNMTVKELAEVTGKTVDEVYEIFLYVDNSEEYDHPNAVIDNLKVSQKTVKLAGLRFIIKVPEVTTELKDVDAYKRPIDKKDLVPRAPVVTIMGHVDHGKTTLLDSLRQSSIVDGEFGGITQHIGAFEVILECGNEVTFLDTPGHAAFSAMRARGANVTDIVILVVAADDGVMEQTRESVRMANESGVPIIVAINKIDKAEADIERCKSMLLNCGIQLEDQGGDIQSVPISALKGTNLDKLLETILTQAELLDVKGDPKGLVEANVIESKMELGRGKVCTCIVNRGTLRKGAVLVAGTCHAKVRNLFNEYGQAVESAAPGKPVQIIGWRDLPSAGDEILEVESERTAHQVVDYRKLLLSIDKEKIETVIIQKKLDEHIKEHRIKLREKRRLGIRYKKWGGQPQRVKFIKFDDRPRVSMVLKGDVDGSLEALLDVIDTYHSDECPIEIISYGVGPVTDSDVAFAEPFKGCVYAFNVNVPRDVRQHAQRGKVPIHEHNIIYKLVDDLKENISSRLPLMDVEEILGEADVLQEFIVTEAKKKIPVAGCLCTKGQLVKDATFRLRRNLEVIYEGKLESMRHLKTEVSTIKKDVECGLRLDETDVRFMPGDTFICFRVNQKSQQTDWSPPGF